MIICQSKSVNLRGSRIRGTRGLWVRLVHDIFLGTVVIDVVAIMGNLIF